MKYLIVISLILYSAPTFAQEEKVNLTLYDGVFNFGYVDLGGYLNFSRPNIYVTHKNSKFILGMLPSLQFKDDRETPKNAFVTPNLGFGLTYSYKFLSVQLPLYYNVKTTTDNGRWHIGLGIGFRIIGVNQHT